MRTPAPTAVLAGAQAPPPEVARISSGSGPAREALSAAYAAAELLLDSGTSGPARLSYADVNAMMRV